MNEIKISLDAEVKSILNTLHNKGFSAYVVGGCVRDSILSREIHDWDITTSATPIQMKEVFKGYNLVETGMKHGTLTLVIKGVGYEVTTYRIDGNYEDNRHPNEVTFVTDIIQDLSRRDFTMNAMAYNTEEGLIDPFNGYQDLLNKQIVCVGEANDRFQEDSLRILRAWRFACQLGFTIEQYTHDCMYSNLDLLDNISVERIQAEFVKAFCGKDFIALLSSEIELLYKIIPELRAMDIPQNNPYHIHSCLKHSFVALKSVTGADLIIRLAVLFHDIGKPDCYTEDENGVGHFYGHAEISGDKTYAILTRLKFDNYTKDNVVKLVKLHDIEFIPKKKVVCRLLNKIGEKQLRRLIKVHIADVLAQNLEYCTERLKQIDDFTAVLEQVLADQNCFQLKNLAVNGHDMINLGLNGKQIGVQLNELLDLVIEDQLENDKDVLLQYVKNKTHNERGNTMEEIHFEVGKSYYDNLGHLVPCTKRTNKSVWLGGYRYNITGFPSEYNNWIESTNYHSADNYNDAEIQRDRALHTLLGCVDKVCDNKPCEYLYENEEEIYTLCNHLKDCLEEYVNGKVKLSQGEEQ